MHILQIGRKHSRTFQRLRYIVEHKIVQIINCELMRYNNKITSEKYSKFCVYYIDHSVLKKYEQMLRNDEKVEHIKEIIVNNVDVFTRYHKLAFELLDSMLAQHCNKLCLLMLKNAEIADLPCLNINFLEKSFDERYHIYASILKGRKFTNKKINERNR